MNITEILILMFCIIAIWIIFEGILRKIVFFTRNEFQWFITKNDEVPNFSKEGLKKFLIHGYDPELGWVRKPNTKHDENGKYGITEWNINEKGARINPKFEDKKSTISCYGDSFTFARQVNNNETWEHQLSKLIETNVQNFGVGNYGIDQALLRLKRDFFENQTKTVIMGVVPDTISRILCIWKHYSEYGNTFGFKPRFILKNDSISIIKNPINNQEKFEKYYEYLDEIRKYDFFYDEKFRKEIIKFPYTISIFKNARRNFGIIFWIQKIHKLKKENKNTEHIQWEPMKYVMKQNLKWRVKLFQDEHTRKLLKKIIEEYVKFSKEQNFKAVFLFLPQKDDILFIKENFHFYKKFHDELKSIKDLFVIDITKELLKEPDLDGMYSDSNDYGGHYSREGNKKIADMIFEKIKKLVSI